MFKRVDAAGKHLVPIYQNRYNPLVQFVRELIREERLGTNQVRWAPSTVR